MLLVHTPPSRQNWSFQVLSSSILCPGKCVETLAHTGVVSTSLRSCWPSCLQLLHAGIAGVYHHDWLMPCWVNKPRALCV